MELQLSGNIFKRLQHGVLGDNENIVVDGVSRSFQLL